MMNLQAQHDCGLSKSLRAIRLSPVASNSSNSGVSKSGKPGQLRRTLTELESALSSWDQIVPDPVDDAAVAPAENSRARMNGMPEEMKRRTRELLDQLKEQIDELSADDTTISN
ncbi:hypothetical protein BH10BDE1_BH10BDE1_02850 [soil metagenome]